MKSDQWSSAKEDIRLRLDLVSVVERYVTLKRSGTNYKGLCPFHKENSPSFMVNPEKGIYHCFGCGKGGDVFAFLMEYEGLSFREVLEQTAKEVGVKLEEAQPRKKANSPSVDRAELYTANEVALRFFYHAMRETPEAVAYFQKRGLSPEIVRDFRLGYAPDGWNGLIDVAHQAGISDAALLMAGLTVTSAQGGRAYDRFRGRIMFPIFDMAGRPIAFGGRTMDPNGQPKYLNSPETPLYQKNRVFYGLNQAREALREKKYVIVVEGYMDLLSLAGAGIHNVVATCGTALTSEHGIHIRRLVSEVYLLFDGDGAGIQATRRAIETLLPLELTIRVVKLPNQEDPDTIVEKGGASLMNSYLQDAVPALDFYVDLLERSVDLSTPQGKSHVADAVADLIGQIRSDMMRSAYLNTFGLTKGAYKIDEAYLRRRANSKERASEGVVQVHLQELKKRLDTEEGSVLHILVSNPSLAPLWIPKIPVHFFTTPLFVKLYSILRESALDAKTLLDDEAIPAELKQVLTMMLLEPSDSREVGMLAHKVEKLQHSAVMRQKQAITAQIAATSNGEKKMALLAELQKITQKPTTGE